MTSPASPQPEPSVLNQPGPGLNRWSSLFSRRNRHFSVINRRQFVTTLSLGLGMTASIACMWRPDALAALTLIPAWLWVVAGLVSTIPVWRIFGRRTACAMTVLWIVFAMGWVEEVSSVTRGVLANIKSNTLPRESRLRIASLNCDSNQRCLADLQRVMPDIVLLQEAPGREALANITRQLFGEDGRFVAGGDTAILARGDIKPLFVDRGAHFVAATVALQDGREQRCVSLRLAPPPSRLDFWTVGFWTEHRDLRHLHREQLGQIMARLRELPKSQGPSSAPVVLGGDFNTSGLDRALDELRPEMNDAFARNGVGWGATGTNEWPLFRVDQIWTNCRLVPLRVSSEMTTSSDHRMVVCDVRLGE